MFFDRLRYELRLHWVTWILVPTVLMGMVGVVALLQRFLAGDPARVLLAGLELLLPLSTALVVGNTLAQEPALELHLTLPQPYYQTGLLRVYLIVGWATCIALLASCFLLICNLVIWPSFARSWPIWLLWTLAQLIWLAPLLWFTALGMCLSLITRSRTACGAILGIAWLVDFVSTGFILEQPWLRPLLLFPTFSFLSELSHVSQAAFATYWFIPKLAVGAVALLLFPIGWLLLRDPERLLQSMNED